MINPSLLLGIGLLLVIGGVSASFVWPVSSIAVPVGVIALIFAITEN